jgi:hypothetical protein
MPAADAGFKIAARVSGRQLATIAGVSCDSWAPAVSEVQTTERLADRVFKARRGRHRFLVYMEAYTSWKASAPWSILAKSGLLSERERLPTVSVVYVLRQRGYRPQGGNFHLGVDVESTQQVWFHEICMWEQQPEPWWDQVPGLMALSPLCRQQRTPHDAVKHAAANISAQTPDAIQRADLLTTLAIFGKLAYPSIDVVGLIGRDQMKESKVIEEFQVETAREYILQVLDAKFGPSASSEFAPLLQAVTDRDRLARLNRLAAQATALKQFRDRFQKT